MLSRINMMNALALAQQLSVSGKKFRCEDGSPLGELVEASTPNATETTTTSVGSAVPLQLTATASSPFGLYPNAEQLVSEVEYTTKGSSSETVHTLKVRNLADQIAPFVTSHLGIARNIVVPLINETEQALVNFITMTKMPSSESQYCIIAAELPALINDESFLAAGLEAFGAGTGDYADFSIRRVVKEPTQLDDVVNGIKNLGNDRLNSLVGQWLGGLPDDFLKNVFLTNFVNEAVISGDSFPYYFDTSISRGSAHNKINVALAVYLIATWLVNNPQETTENVSLTVYKELMDATRIVSGNLVNRLRARIDTQTSANVLVSEYDAVQKKIVVNAGLYKNWLAEGGTPEALLGYLVSGVATMDYRLALENKERGCRAWDTYVGLENSNNAGKLRDAFKSYARSYMLTSLTELTEIEKEFCPAEKAHREKVMKLVDEQIEHFSHRITEDIGHLALHLVAKCRFYFTASYQLLDEMREISKGNPDIDPREAAAMATLTYISDYLADQVTLLKA